MNCAVFENELTRLLAGEFAARERPAVVERLRAHRESCTSCRRSGDLLEWSALDEDERFHDEDPGEAYWSSFDGRLKQRLAAEHSPVNKRKILIWTAAASLMAVLILGSWYIAGRKEPAGVVANAGRDVLPGEEIELAIPTGLVDDIAELEVEDQDEWLGTLPGSISYPADWSGDDSDSDQVPAAGGTGTWALPYTGDLDDEGRRELLDWLREEVSGKAGGQA